MCFSPSASFTAGTILTLIGIKSISDSKKSTRLLACIPLLFAAQQVTEGIIWLMLLHHQEHELTLYIPYIFLFFAFIVWPVWIPLSILPLVPKKRIRLMRGILAMGILLSVYLSASLLYYGATAEIIHHHIYYYFESFFHLYWLGIFIYWCITVVPWFLTTDRLLWLLGSAAAISYCITYIFYTEFLVSIWCFFTAVLSVIIVFAVRSRK